MKILLSFFKSICLLLLTVLAIMLVNIQFTLLTGLYSEEQRSIFFIEPWQFYLFYLCIFGALMWAFFSKWFVCHFMKIKLLSDTDDKSITQTYHLLVQLSAKKNITPPQLAVYDSSDINAFTTGFSQKHAIVVVSSGLLYGLNYDEQEAVLAHELTHIINYDMLTLSLMQGVINLLIMLPSHLAGWFFDKKILQRKNVRGPAYYLVWLTLQASLGFVATMLVMWFSRWREFRADKGAAMMVGAASMQTVLTCLKVSRQHEELTDELGLFGISGTIGKGLKRLFASHPPLNERIMALKEDWH